MRASGFLLALLLACCPPLRAAELVFAVQAGSDVPMTVFDGLTLTGGILKEVGDAIAGELGQPPRYIILPRMRVEAALLQGQADLLCDLRPEWLDSKQLLWSDAIISNRMIVASRRDTSMPATLDGLAGRRIGTVRGYRYPELDRLHPAILRDDAQNDAQSLEKLLRRRFDYVLTNRIYFDYQRKVHPDRKLLAPQSLSVTLFDTYCAARPDGNISLVALNRAIANLKARGALAAIMDRYRPATK